MISRSAEETKRIAADLAATLCGGELLLLEGELGAGKTTFVQGLAEALGTDAARSPTFAVMNVYETDRLPVRELVHLDFYRLQAPEQADELGLEDWLGRRDAIVVAEWPPASLPVPPATPIIRVSLRAVSPFERDISIEKV
jgi:tRNA threonylcarbamoyladenosine biosynthesis protein TsaE